MSRVARLPVQVPTGVELKISPAEITAKGPLGQLAQHTHHAVIIKQEGAELTFEAANSSKESRSLAGTYRALVANMVHGVSKGFEKKLSLVGVGYRAQAQGQKLNLSLAPASPGLRRAERELIYTLTDQGYAMTAIEGRVGPASG